MKINLKYLFILIGLLVATDTFAQIGIGTNTPAASAALEITSDTNNKGILIPRITATQKDAIVSPAEGLMIYQTTAPIGFYYYSGSVWKLIAIQTDVESKVDKVSGKDLSSNDYTAAEKTKLAAISGTNTGDQDLSIYATNTALALKANTSDITTSLATKVDKATGKDLSTNDYTTAEKTKLAAISGTNTGDQTTITGNAGTATKLATPRKINNVDFDGSSDISIPINAGAITGTVAVANGGTGTTTVNGILSTLGFANNNIAIGAEAGTPGQGVNANTVAIGGGAGRLGQGQSAIGIGYVAGTENQGANGIAIGSNTAQANQATQALALGFAAGQYNQGANAVAIGSFAGNNSQQANSIAINATGASLNPTNAGFYVDPIRNAAASQDVLYYNPTTKEITSATASGSFVDLSTDQTIAGNKTFSSDLTINGVKIGKGAGQNDQNTAIGAGALNSSNASGTRNTAVGYLALKDYVGTSFDNNTGVGYFNMIGLTTGGGNTSVGAETMFNVASGSNNTGIGNQSLISTSGNNNVGVGAQSGDNLTSGSNNTFLGTQAKTTSAGATISNATAIGYGAEVAANNQIQLGNGSVTNVKTSGTVTAGSITYPNVSGTNGQFLTTDGSGTASWATLPGGLSAQWTASNNDIYFSTGKVGIGLSNPGSMFNTNLDVAGRSSFRINSTNQALVMDGSSGFSRLYTDATSGTPDNLILGTYPNGHMKQLYLKQSNGFVGINNDNPSEQLDVVGSIKTTGTIKAGAITYPNISGTNGQVLTTDGSGTASWGTLQNIQYAQVLLSSLTDNTPVTVGGISVRVNNTEGFGPELEISRISNGDPSTISVFATVYKGCCSAFNASGDNSGGPISPKFGTTIASASVGTWGRLLDRANGTSQIIQGSYFKLEADLSTDNSTKSYKLTVLTDGWGKVLLRLTYFP